MLFVVVETVKKLVSSILCRFNPVNSPLVYLGGFLLYLNIFHYIFISFFNVFICRISCIVELLIYQGTFSIVLKVLDWNLCIISMLEFKAVPQSFTLYVQIGLITALHKNNLLSVDSVVFPVANTFFWTLDWVVFFPFWYVSPRWVFDLHAFLDILLRWLVVELHYSSEQWDTSSFAS
jgi:hypothetical protein